jgi:hypothetical protein
MTKMISEEPWPVAELATELQSSQPAVDEELGDTTSFEVLLFELFAGSPERQPASKAVTIDVDWLMSDDAPVSSGLQDSMLRGLVRGTGANRPPKPRSFISDVSLSVDEMLLDAGSVGGGVQRDLASFAKQLHKGEKGRLRPARVEGGAFVSMCTRLGVDPLRLVDAFHSLALKNAHHLEPALMQGQGDDDWSDLRERVQQALGANLGGESPQ